LKEIPFYVSFVVGGPNQARIYGEILSGIKDDSYKALLIELNKEQFNEEL
jgi:hypothetical protein